MQITPIEIRQKRFEKKFRGYHVDEVDAFLHSLAHTWEKVTTQFNELKSTVEVYKKDIERLKNIENALLKTVRDGETTAVHMIEQAKKEAELIIKEAALEAERLVQEANIQARLIEEQSRQASYQLKLTKEQELVAAQAAVQGAISYKEEVLRQLQRLGKELLEKSQVSESNSISEKAERGIYDE
jgi:cell division initiation protein